MAAEHYFGEPYATVNEVIARLNVSMSTFYNMERMSQLGVVVAVDSQLFISKADLSRLEVEIADKRKNKRPLAARKQNLTADQAREARYDLPLGYKDAETAIRALTLKTEQADDVDRAVAAILAARDTSLAAQITAQPQAVA
jgi:hypothetical protein